MFDVLGDTGLRPAKDREGFVAVIDLSVSLLKALERSIAN